MSGTSHIDADVMNRKVSKMVEEALKYNKVESVLEEGEKEDLFSPEYFETLVDVVMPATKLELLIKLLKQQIKDYSKTNQVAAKKFQEMLEKQLMNTIVDVRVFLQKKLDKLKNKHQKILLNQQLNKL